MANSVGFRERMPVRVLCGEGGSADRECTPRPSPPGDAIPSGPATLVAIKPKLLLELLVWKQPPGYQLPLLQYQYLG